MNLYTLKTFSRIIKQQECEERAQKEKIKKKS